jgi:hypothetical protein
MAIYSLRLTPIGKTTQQRPYTAAAHVRYIARPGAASHVMAARMPENKGRAQRWLRAAEKADRKNARVADKLVIALPKELTLEQNIALVRTFADTLTKGRASWFSAIHARGKDRHNPHLHLLVRDHDVQTGERVVMFSAGPKEARARAAKGKTLPTTLHAIRELWEKSANEALEAAGRSERIDRRRLAAQGITRAAQVHEGPNIRAMHRRGHRPRSRDRLVRKRPGRQQGVRTVRYAEIDRGQTRAEYNDALRASARASAMVARVQARPTAVERAIPRQLDAFAAEARTTPLHQVAALQPSAYVHAMTDSAADLNKELASMHEAFGVARGLLQTSFAQDFRAPGDVVEALLSHADEFGAEHAVERLCEDPRAFGETDKDGGYFRERREELAATLSALIDRHDALDLAQLRAEASAKRGGGTREIHIQGELFAIDIDARGLLSAERVEVREEQKGETRSLAEMMVRTLDTPRAEPLSEQEREQERKR